MENTLQEDGLIVNNAFINHLKGNTLVTDMAYGLVPVGGIVAVGYNYNLPASGVVSSEGFMRCDGAAIPAGNTLTGNTYNLTTNRMIKYSGAAGSIGGVSSVALTESHMQFHNHGTISKEVTGGSHSHTLTNGSGCGASDHTHNLYGLYVKAGRNSGSTAYYCYLYSNVNTALPTSTGAYSIANTVNGGPATQYVNAPVAVQGATGAGTSVTVSAYTSQTHGHTPYMSHTNYGSSNPSISIIPKQFFVIYMVRVI